MPLKLGVCLKFSCMPRRARDLGLRFRVPELCLATAQQSALSGSGPHETSFDGDPADARTQHDTSSPSKESLKCLDLTLNLLLLLESLARELVLKYAQLFLTHVVQKEGGYHADWIISAGFRSRFGV